MTLKQLFQTHGTAIYPTDKDTHHTYLDIYDDLFLRFKEDRFNLLEVGTWKGGSLKLFEDYFPFADIIGYDIIAPSVKLRRAQVILKDFYAMDPAELPMLSIAIDDGTHHFEDQIKFVQKVYPKILPGGLLIVEDIWPGYREHFDKLQLPYTLIEHIPHKDEDNDRMIIFRK